MSHLQYIASQGSVHQARHERDIYFGSLIRVLFLLHFELQTLIKTFSEEGEISVQEQYIVGKVSQICSTNSASNTLAR